MDGYDPADEHQWWHPGEAAAAVAAADVHDSFLDMFATSTEDLFTLVWEGNTAAGHGQPAISSVPSSPPPPELPRVSLEPPPSDDVMTAWLYPIVSGGTDHASDGTEVQMKGDPDLSTRATTTLGMAAEGKCKLAATEDLSGTKDTNTRTESSERRKAASEGSNRATRSSHRSRIHNITEKRRRCKFSDRLRTLQQLVPGCHKSNQASTLEQTIQYMKSLQEQVQSMSTAVYPVVPYGAMIPYVHYHAHAVMMPAAASSALPAMMPAPATSAAPEGQCSISTEQQRKHKEKRRS